MLNALFALLLAAAPAAPVCHWNETAPNPPARDGYSLCIFGGNWFDLGLGYEGPTALEKLRKQDAKAAIACFGPESIESFEWNTQRLTLTREATGRLVHAIRRYDSQVERTGAAAEFAAGEEKLKKLMDSLDWSSDIEMDLQLRAFQVRVDDKPIYGGIFLDPTSQMGISFPVARVDAVSDCRAAFNFLPTHMPFVTEDPVDEAGKVRKLDVTPEAQEDTKALDEDDNFFTGWITNMALSPEAAELRKLVRDPAIQHSLEKAGKLAPGS
ncbi:MAG TPA: hypothetical protein VH394_17875 [Thermoanaerobaculia bacterium]|jgi:hypothetical protein|nr:hypothetical protein [Thermoanaerobaculia bacterium]